MKRTTPRRRALPVVSSATAPVCMPLLAIAGLLAALPAHADDTSLPAVVVRGARPIPGLEVPRDIIPSAVQTVTGETIRQSRSLDVGDFMNRNLGSVHINETQGNPFQIDVNYRGYTASPLLGTPQGLSVFVDGVRMNQAFGDVVSWDLIPRTAIKSMTLVPGSNPLFGLNTLGGALSIETKDGFNSPGTSLQTTLGSNARRSVGVEHGGRNRNGLGWYVTTELYKDRGWREESPSDLKQLFGKLSWRDADTSLNLSIAHADNTLHGNGLQEQRLLERDWRSVYTKPDITGNRSTLFSLGGSRELGQGLSISGNAYYRTIRTGTFNGDINEDALDQAVYQPGAAERAALAAAGYRGYPTSGATAANTPFPSWRCIAQALLRDEPAEKCNGLINRSSTRQTNYGVAGQLSLDGSLGQHRHQLTTGAAFNGSRVDFAQSTQLGYLNPDRGITGVNAFGDGVTGGDVDGAPYDTRVDINGRQRTWSLYATDTFSFD